MMKIKASITAIIYNTQNNDNKVLVIHDNNKRIYSKDDSYNEQNKQIHNHGNKQNYF